MNGSESHCQLMTTKCLEILVFKSKILRRDLHIHRMCKMAPIQPVVPSSLDQKHSLLSWESQHQYPMPSKASIQLLPFLIRGKLNVREEICWWKAETGKIWLTFFQTTEALDFIFRMGFCHINSTQSYLKMSLFVFAVSFFLSLSGILLSFFQSYRKFCAIQRCRFRQIQHFSSKYCEDVHQMFTDFPHPFYKYLSFDKTR